MADQDLEVEHIVQDGCSDDGTAEWLARNERVNSHVENDRGMYDAINKGLKRAHGDILAYLNCDEQYLPGALVAVRDYFEAHPGLEVVFADAIAVNREGEYLWHRKALVPLELHSSVYPLSVLTCATFFRRSIVERGFIFDPAWRICGDSVWILSLIRAGVRMGVLRRFTSVFTHTGSNLSLDPKARVEGARLRATAPWFARAFGPLILAHHRLRRLFGGVYYQKPFTYRLYTHARPDKRVTKSADHPTFRWKW